MNILGVVPTLVKGVTEVFKARETRKLTQVTAKSKLAAAKQGNEHEVTLTDAEWESLNVDKLDRSWKDEYVTIIITCPIPLILIAAIVAAFTSDTRTLDGVTAGLTALSTLGVDMGFLMNAVVLAAVGLKIWRS